MPELATGHTLPGRENMGGAAFEIMIEAEQRGFIAANLMPFRRVRKQASKFPTIPVEVFLKLLDLSRAPKGVYARDDWKFKTGSYSCEEYGFEDVLDDVEKDLYIDEFDAAIVGMERGTDKVLRGFEKRTADLLMDTAVITTTQAAAAVWSNQASATPRADVIALKTKMRNNRGIIPNVGAMSYNTFQELLDTNAVTNKMQYTNVIELANFEQQKRLMATYLTLDKIEVSNALYDTAKKGQTSTLTDIWPSTKVGLYRVSSGGDNIIEPVIGRTMLWDRYSANELLVKAYRQEEINSDITRVAHYVDETIIYAGAGGIITGI